MKYVIFTWLLTAAFWPFLYIVTQDSMMNAKFMEIWTVMTSLSFLFSLPALLLAGLLFLLINRCKMSPPISFLLWVLTTAITIGGYSLVALNHFYIVRDERFIITVILLCTFVFFSLTRFRHYLVEIAKNQHIPDTKVYPHV